MISQELLGITYSEFDNTMGPQLRYEYPSGIIEEDFEELSDYVIVGKKLSNKVITIIQPNYQYSNYPIALENPKYDRNTLTFAIGLVVDPNVDTRPYETLLRKMSLLLRSLEVESEFLFNSNTKIKLKTMLRSVYEQIRNTGEVFIQMDSANVLSCQLFKSCIEPMEVKDWQVPVLLYDDTILRSFPWEISLNHVLPQIDGRRCAKRIATESEIDVEIVKKCIRMLMWYGVATVSDAIKFSNIYRATASISALATPLGTRRLYTLLYPTKSRVEDEDLIGKENRKAKEAVLLLFTLEPRKPLKEALVELFEQGFTLDEVDVVRLIAIAQHMGLLKRMHEYPMHKITTLNPSHPEWKWSLGQQQMNQLMNKHSNSNKSSRGSNERRTSGTWKGAGTMPMFPEEEGIETVTALHSNDPGMGAPLHLHIPGADSDEERERGNNTASSGLHSNLHSGLHNHGRIGPMNTNNSSNHNNNNRYGRSIGSHSHNSGHSHEERTGPSSDGRSPRIGELAMGLGSLESSHRTVLRHADGTRCLDDLCCEYNASTKSILEDEEVCTIWK